METCDEEFAAGARDFIKRANDRRQAVLRMAQHYANALYHSHARPARVTEDNSRGTRKALKAGGECSSSQADSGKEEACAKRRG
jgi:hypothetical protein